MPSVIAVARDVEGAAEDAREGQHVVDLVGEVGAAGGDHPRVPGATSGCTSGVGLARPKMIASSAIVATTSSGTVPPETPM